MDKGIQTGNNETERDRGSKTTGVHPGHFITLLLGSLAFFLASCIIVFPKEAFEASLKGLLIWWEVLLPAQLPFFIISEILMGFGVVHFLGVLLEPLMRPLFRVPGSGSFVLAMGLTSGNPIGAKLTARLREKEMITRVEGERLVAFTSTAGPLFIFGTVAVGFFYNAALGIILAIVHYTSNLIVGLLMRFYHPHEPESVQSGQGKKRFIVFRAFRAMHQARIEDGRALGQLLSDAVMSALKTALMVGGFIVFFAVAIDILRQVHGMQLINTMATTILTPLGIPADVVQAAVPGLFEMTLGAQSLSEVTTSVPLIWVVTSLSAVIAFSGLSIHAQVVSLLSSTDIRFGPYIFSRILHAVLAFIVTFMAWKPLQKYLATAQATQDIPAILQERSSGGLMAVWNATAFLTWMAVVILCILTACSLVIQTLNWIYGKHEV